MPRFITLTEIDAILQSGDFTRLFGAFEDDHLECKSAPYNLDQEREKMELAKDVSALANTDGGIILLGVQTEQEPTYQGDIIRRVGCFAQQRIDFGQYERVISDWVLPSIPGLRLVWHASAANGNEGIVSILVPQEASRERPYVVTKLVENTGRTVGTYVGFFERTRDSATPTKPSELRDRLRDGRRFAELDTRLGNIEEMIGRITPGQEPQQPAFGAEIIFGRVQRARREMGYEGKPALSLAAWPLQSTDFPNLFESHEVPVVRLLEQPPRLRDGGFDFATRRLSAIVEGRLRRCLIPEHKILEVWRDGPLICVVPGDDWHLCWGMRSTAETGLRINNLALAETVYLFCDWTLKVYGNAVPPPETFKIRVMLSDMTVNGIVCSLSPYRPNDFTIGENQRPAPGAQAGQHFEIDVERATGNAGVMAYRILSDVYAWFGFNSAEMPYVDRNGESPKIDLAQIR
jgi:hypothetical protein